MTGIPGWVMSIPRYIPTVDSSPEPSEPVLHNWQYANRKAYSAEPWRWTTEVDEGHDITNPLECTIGKEIPQIYDWLFFFFNLIIEGKSIISLIDLD